MPLSFQLVENNQLRNVIECWRRDPELGPNSGIEEELKCPITMSPMQDAVLTCDGHSYEREAIIRWLRRHDSVRKSSAPAPSKTHSHTQSNVWPVLAEVFYFR